MIRVLSLLLAALCLCACGFGPQERPTPIDVPTPTSGQQPSDGVGRRAVVLYFVREARLEPVVRAGPDASPSTAIQLLLVGPTPSEAASGLRTVVPPQSLLSATRSDPAGTVEVAASRQFTNVSGATQLIAVAQLVWTITERPGITRVRITIDGRPVEVPTDRGLTGRAVSRSDYISVAPALPTEPPAAGS